MNSYSNSLATGKAPFDPKRDPAVQQSHISIRASGIEFHSRYGVLAELRMMIIAVETYLPRGLFWHIEKIECDSKGGGIHVTLKQRDGSMQLVAYQIASILKGHLESACTSVTVDNHLGERLADSWRC